jgi:hypothetical protein
METGQGRQKEVAHHLFFCSTVAFLSISWLFCLPLRPYPDLLFLSWLK